MVTAIVSAYYADKYLHGRLTNLFAQSPESEVIVVCQQGSPEFEIAHAFGNEVRIITTPDVPTIYRAWNLAIAEAHGDFITNANCDDRLYTGALAQAEQALCEHPEAAVVYFDSDMVEKVDGDPVNRFMWNEGGLKELLDGCFVGPMPVWRARLHRQYGMFDAEMKSAGDYEFWLRIAHAGEKLFHLRRCLGAYLRRSDSLEHRESVRSLWETARARSRYPVTKEI